MAWQKPKILFHFFPNIVEVLKYIFYLQKFIARRTGFQKHPVCCELMRKLSFCGYVQQTQVLFMSSKVFCCKNDAGKNSSIMLKSWENFFTVQSKSTWEKDWPSRKKNNKEPIEVQFFFEFPFSAYYDTFDFTGNML